MCIWTPCIAVEENLISGAQPAEPSWANKPYLYIISQCSPLPQCLMDIFPWQRNVYNPPPSLYCTIQVESKTPCLSNRFLSGCCMMPSGLQFFFPKLESHDGTELFWGMATAYQSQFEATFFHWQKWERCSRNALCGTDFSYLALHDYSLPSS